MHREIIPSTISVCEGACRERGKERPITSRQGVRRGGADADQGLVQLHPRGVKWRRRRPKTSGGGARRGVWVAGWAFGLGRCLPAGCGGSLASGGRIARTGPRVHDRGLDPSEQRTRQVRVNIGPFQMLDASSTPAFLSHVPKAFRRRRRDLVSRHFKLPTMAAALPRASRENADRAPTGSTRLSPSVPIKIRRSFDYRISSATRMVGVACADEDELKCSS